MCLGTQFYVGSYADPSARHATSLDRCTFVDVCVAVQSEFRLVVVRLSFPRTTGGSAAIPKDEQSQTAYPPYFTWLWIGLVLFCLRLVVHRWNCRF